MFLATKNHIEIDYFNCIQMHRIAFFPLLIIVSYLFFVKINTYFQAATAQFLLWLYLCKKFEKSNTEKLYWKKNLYSTAAIYNHFSIIPIVRYTSTFIFRRICGI